jgi:hypothetical protein
MGSHLQPAGAGPERSMRRGLGRLLTIGALALAFFLVPTLQGISLVADQSEGETQSSRSADDVATSEVLRLVKKP